MNNRISNILPVLIAILLFSCTYEKPEVVPYTGYPTAVENILVNKCATSGCHNSISRVNAEGLDFSTWELMFEGGRNGTSVVPFSTQYSYMIYSINTDTNRGPVLLPTMPYLQNPLSEEEYQTIYKWIAAGAPDKNGFVKFSDDPNRKKVYVCMQGCDKVAVFDAKTKVIMRYINVGVIDGFIEGPHMVRVSPDNKYWYVVYVNGSYLQKFRTSDDSLVASLNIGSGTWNSIIITQDGNKGFINSTTNNSSSTNIAIVNLANMTIEINKYLDFPHGGFSTPDGNFMYITNQYGHYIYKIDLNDPGYQEDQIDLAPGQIPAPSLDPHEMILSPDSSKYFVACQASNEVRVYNASNDNLIVSIPVGVKPQEFAVSTKHPYLLVTCTEDPVSPGQVGTVYIIDYNTLSFVKKIYTGYQPHGIAIDDEEDIAYVANLNYDPNGPAPHHVTECGGRNGNMAIIDLSNLQLYRKTFSDGSQPVYRNEVLPFPYFVSIRY